MKRLLVIVVALVVAQPVCAESIFDEANRNLRDANRELDADMRSFLDHRDRRAAEDQRELDARYSRQQMNVIIQELAPGY